MTRKDSPGFERSSGSLSTSVFQRALLGDQEAFRKITDLFSGLVYYWCRKRGLSEEDAQDTSQEVFKTVATKLDSFHRESASHSFFGWIRTITKNKVMDHYRAEAKRIRPRDPCDELPEIPSPPEADEDLRREKQELAQRAVQLIRQEFSDRDYQAFCRFAVNHVPAKAVAAEFGMTPNAVFIAVSRIKRRVREEFGDLIEMGNADHAH